MEENSLYHELKTKYYQYCLGKSPSVLIAACRYIEGLVGKQPYKKLNELTKEYNISDTSLIKRVKEIDVMFQFKQYLKTKCEFCGEEIKLTSPARKVCFQCRRNLAKRILERWEKTSICIICGETNPLLLLPTGHHLIGDKSSFTIPICANCHGLTKPRTRQSFFLFEKWNFPDVKFTQDNSPVYILIK